MLFCKKKLLFAAALSTIISISSNAYSTEKGAKSASIVAEGGNGTYKFEDTKNPYAIASRIWAKKDGKFINKSSSFKIEDGGEIELEKNDTQDPDEPDSEKAMKHTGVLHNYTRIFGSGAIIGDGYIYNYGGYIVDRDDTDYKDKKSESDYGNATYFDLANDAGVTQFKIYAKGEVADTVSVDDGNTNKRTDRTASYNNNGRNTRIKEKKAKTEFLSDDFYDNSGNATGTPDADQKEIAYSLVPGDGADAGTIVLNAKSAKLLSSSFYSLTGYTAGRLGAVPQAGPQYGTIRKTGTTVDFKSEVSNPDIRESEWTNDDPVIRVTGDMSWFNGDFYIDEGGVIIDENGAIFGGNIEMSQYTELEWQGGAKDEYNRPTITMNGNSKIFFNLKNASVFSAYAKIIGTPTDRVIFEKGNVYIKNDCSGFRGKVQVYDGAEFFVRKSDDGSSSQYTGVMFGGTYEVLNEKGEVDPKAEITVKSNSGLKPINFNSGVMRIVQDNEGDSQAKTPVDELTIGTDGKVILEYGDTKLTDTVIKGQMELGGGEFVEFTNLNLDRGDILISGDALKRLVINGSVNMGSSIQAWGNEIIDDIYINVDPDTGAATLGTFGIYDGRNLDFYVDLDPATNKSDRIVANNIDFTNGSSLAIKDYKMLNAPIDEVHVFQVLKLIDANAKYIPITLGQEAETKEIKGKYGIYKLYIEGGDGFITLRTPNTKISGLDVNGITPEQLNTLNNKFLPIQAMHMSGINHSATTYNTICDTFGYSGKEETLKSSFWNKSYAATSKQKTSSHIVDSSEYGSIFGFDAKPMQIKNKNTYFMPTIFGNYTARSMEYSHKKARQNEYLIGGKVAWFSRKASFELIGSYELMKTRMVNTISDINNIKSHVYSGGIKVAYNIRFGKYITVRPDILGNYSFTKTPKFDIEKDLSVKNKSIHTFDIAPGFNILAENKKWKASIGARMYKKIGSLSKSSLKNHDIDTAKQKKQYMEFSLGASRKAGEKSELGFNLSKMTNGVNGFKATININVKF